MSTPSPASSKTLGRVGLALSILPGLLLLFSAVMKIAHPPALDEGFQHLGLDVSYALGLGVLELICTVIYLVPQTAVLGAILLTGYLGGAIFAHLRLGEAYVTQALLGVVIWAGLGLRDARLRTLLPLRQPLP